MKPTKPILLVEDDAVDQMTVKRAFRQLKIAGRLDIAANGVEALALLENGEKELPGLIILDINMPKMNGIEFLQIVKGDVRLKTIPVVVLTTSREEQDKVESFEHGVAGYIVKPIDYEDFIEVVRAIDSYWRLSERADPGPRPGR